MILLVGGFDQYGRCFFFLESLTLYDKYPVFNDWYYHD